MHTPGAHIYLIFMGKWNYRGL